jgi:hypothetical protein
MVNKATKALASCSSIKSGLPGTVGAYSFTIIAYEPVRLSPVDVTLAALCHCHISPERRFGFG